MRLPFSAQTNTKVENETVNGGNHEEQERENLRDANKFAEGNLFFLNAVEILQNIIIYLLLEFASLTFFFFCMGFFSRGQ